MEINYIHENPKAVLRQEHAATIRLQLEETLGTFNGFFFVTLFLNAAVQRLSFGYVTRSSFFNDVRFRLHILEPYVEGRHEASNCFNYHTFVVAAPTAGNLVHTVGPVDKTAPAGHTVFQIKGSYEDQELSKYKALRLKLHAPYTV